MRTLKPALIPLLLLALGACASGTGGLAAIPSLEQQAQRSPSNAAVNRALGIAYYQANRYAEARTALEKAAQLDPRDGTTALYLGLTAESQNDLPAAKRAYSSYLQFGRTSRVRSQLQARLAALARRELAQEAKAAVAQEASLAKEPGNPRTIAVMPLRFTGSDSTLQPLERGFADLLTTDLARSSQVTLVERSRLQALLDEMALQKTSATDASTSARAGRLVRAGRVVQGGLLQLPSTQKEPVLRVDAAVVDANTAQVSGAAQGTDALEQIFGMEKRLALDLFNQLGVTLTVAERNAIEERPTRSLAAFLSYSRGLEASDAGRYDEASRFFNDAVRLDPGFSMAQQKGQQAQSAAVGATLTPKAVEASLQGSAEEKVATAASQGQAANGTGSSGGLTGAAQNTADGLNSSTAGSATASATTTSSTPAPPAKDPVSSGTNSENTSTTGVVRFVLPRTPQP